MIPYNRPDDYSPQELMTGAGINTPLYNQWLYRNIFSATNPAEGPGTISRYSFNDILTVAFIVKLRTADIRLKRASSIAHDIVTELTKWKKKNKSEDWPKVYVIFRDKGVKIEVADSGKWEMVMMLDTDSMVANIMGRIEEV